jgi:peptidoglycan/xylan/chitin deacetylase (PgdA/CDA1 family)
MYHRIATDGPPGLEQFRVPPQLFEEQLSALKQAGFQSFSLSAWVDALFSRSEALPEKPVILTFDDGYRDFLISALPLLQRHSLTATVFVVAARIGGSADWDLRYGEAAPLMSWPELGEIRSEGIELGCHSLAHRPMTEMNEGELVADTLNAREILEQGLGHPIAHFAYPYGAENASVRKIVADLGFDCAVTCQPGLSWFEDDLMRLPRIEVTGSCLAEELLVQLAQ